MATTIASCATTCARARAVPTIATISPESIPQGGGTFTLTVNGSRFHGNSVVNFNGSPLATQFLSETGSSRRCRRPASPRAGLSR